MLAPIYTFLAGGELDPFSELTILEIGAARGEDTVRLRACFPRARIFCFEPDPRNIQTLKGGVLPPGCTLVEAAVSDVDGTAVFHQSDGSHPAPEHVGKPWTYSSSLKQPEGHLQAHPWVSFERQVEVRTVRLDTFFAQHGLSRIDFIWADVQGAEDLVIAGGAEALSRTAFFYTEYDDRPLYSGQIGLADIHRRLPGGEAAWRMRAKWREDALFQNLRV